jgi:hypothetical protein
MSGRLRPLFLPILVVGVLLAGREARAMDAIVFASTGSPGDAWGSGLGASLSSNLFHLVMLDA